jgi:hypothetical protein
MMNHETIQGRTFDNYGLFVNIIQYVGFKSWGNLACVSNSWNTQFKTVYLMIMTRNKSISLPSFSPQNKNSLVLAKLLLVALINNLGALDSMNKKNLLISKIHLYTRLFIVKSARLDLLKPFARIVRKRYSRLSPKVFQFCVHIFGHTCFAYDEYTDYNVGNYFADMVNEKDVDGDGDDSSRRTLVKKKLITAG